MATTLMRGLLTGTFTDDTSDTDPDKGCIADVKVDDAGETNSILKVRLLLPNDVPCPAYAVKIWLYDETTGATVEKRKVIVRRDTDDANNTCLTAIIQPILSAIVKTKWSETNTKVGRAEFSEIDIYSTKHAKVTGKMGFFPNIDFGPSTIGVNTPVILSNRVPRDDAPDGHLYAWVTTPVGGSESFISIANIRSGNIVWESDDSTFQIKGIKYDSGTSITEVPSVDPMDTDPDTFDNNLGRGALFSTGEIVWVALRADPGTGVVTGVISNVPEFAAIISYSSVQIPLTGDPDTLVTVYIISRI